MPSARDRSSSSTDLQKERKLRVSQTTIKVPEGDHDDGHLRDGELLIVAVQLRQLLQVKVGVAVGKVDVPRRRWCRVGIAIVVVSIGCLVTPQWSTADGECW